MKARLGFVLVLILATLASGCNRYDIGGVESATLSIETARYGAMPLPAHTAGTDSHVHDSRTPIQVSGNRKIENTLYIKRGDFNIANINAYIFRLDVKKNTDTSFFRFDTRRKTATQVAVQFGAITDDLIEIKSGLQEGDQVDCE